MFYKSFLFFVLLFFSSVYAKEPLIARLQHIYSNSTLRFQVEQTQFVCKTYGVVSLDELLERSTSGSNCKKAIETFYKRNENLRYFAFNHLFEHQMYHLSLKKQNRCLVYAQGEYTYSEMLLESGLGFMQNNFKDKEWKYSFTKAEKNAKIAKKGVWNTTLFSKCIKEYYMQ